MKLAGLPISIILILFVAAVLIMKYSLSSSPLFLFSLFNTIFLAIMVGSCRPYVYEVDEVLPFFLCGSDELGVDALDNRKENSDEDDEYDHEYHGSDGYDDDNKYNGSEDEVGWEEKEGSDDNLRERIEGFIAKVNNGWRDERLRDKLGPGRPD